MTTNVSLPPALEKFARDCVADGRYSNVSEKVVRSWAAVAPRLLREREEARSQFTASIEEAQAEADRDGTFTIEEVLAEVDEIIDSARKVSAAAISRRAQRELVDAAEWTAAETGAARRALRADVIKVAELQLAKP